MAVTINFNWAIVFGSDQLNASFEAGPQGDVAVAGNTAGTRYFATWTNNTTTSDAILGRFVANSGTPIGTEGSSLNSTTTNEQFDSAVAGLLNGNFVLSFTDTSADANGDIRARLFSGSASGTAVSASIGDDFGVATGAGRDRESAVTGLADGRFAVTFTREFTGTPGDFDVEYRVFNADGTPFTGVLNASSPLASLRSDHSSVAGLAGGGFVVAYTEQPSAGGSTQVRFRLVNAAGVAIGPASGVLIDNIGNINQDIQVVGLPDGGFAVAYTDNGWAISGTEITTGVFNADGTQRTPLLRVNTATTGNQDEPDIALLSNGFYAVSWADGATVNYQAFTPNGLAVGTNIQPIVSNSIEAEIAGLAHGLLVNVRSSTLADGGGDNSVRTTGHEFRRTIVSDAAADTFTGDSLRDTFTGNGGNDVVVYVPGGGADAWTDFAAGIETPDQVNLTAFGLSLARALSALATQVGADTVFNFGGGDTLTLQNVLKANLNGNDFLGLRPADRDFNADFKGDILFQHDNGAIGIWLLDGVNVQQFSPAIPHPGDGWHVSDTGDFDFDGKADILWQHDNGTPAVWRFDKFTPIEFGPALSNPGAPWHIIAAADFDGNSKSDIFFQHDNGAIGIWLMDGVNVAQFSPAIPHPGDGWHAKDAADFNGDGKADVLWQHDNGTPAVWRFDGLDPIEFGPALSNPGPAWHIAAGTDFNGDRKADILFQHDNGTIGIWLMDGVNVATFSPAIPHPGDGWHIKDAVDSNGDGKADIIWQHDNGTPAVWTFDGLNPTSFGPALSNPGSAWHII